jgi:membrane-associated phospholipid phosphatase
MSASGAAAERMPSRIRALRGQAARALATLVRPPRGGPTPRWRTFGRVATGTVVTVAVLAALMVFVDAPAIIALRSEPVWLYRAADWLSDFGRSGWFLLPLAVMLAVVALVATTARPHVAQLVLASIAVRCAFLFSAIAVPGLVGTLAKRLIGRSRPQSFAPVDAFAYWPLIWRSEYASLPSGHANTAFAALIAIGALWPRLRPLMWAYAVLIAASRVIVFAHFPSDVVAGAVVGGVGAVLVRDWFAARRLGFTIAADGRVQPLPGPSFARIKKVAGRLPAP